MTVLRFLITVVFNEKTSRGSRIYRRDEANKMEQTLRCPHPRSSVQSSNVSVFLFSLSASFSLSSLTSRVLIYLLVLPLCFHPNDFSLCLSLSLSLCVTKQAKQDTEKRWLVLRLRFLLSEGASWWHLVGSFTLWRGTPTLWFSTAKIASALHKHLGQHCDPSATVRLCSGRKRDFNRT